MSDESKEKRTELETLKGDLMTVIRERGFVTAQLATAAKENETLRKEIVELRERLEALKGGKG